MSQASLLPHSSGGKPRERRVVDHAREVNDWYVEPIWATELLFRALDFVGPIWDPCCGQGNILKAVCSAGNITNGVRATDLVDRGYGDAGIDFLLSSDWAQNIVFNPPYLHAEAFILHALKLASGKVAALVNLKFLASQGRRERLFKPHPPLVVLILSRRPSMPPGGQDIPAKGGTADYCWIVWENEGDRIPDDHRPVIGWLA